MLFVSTYPADPIFVPTLNFYVCIRRRLYSKNTMVGTMVHVTCPSILILIIICCPFPHEYVLLVSTLDAVFSHFNWQMVVWYTTLMKKVLTTYIPYFWRR